MPAEQPDPSTPVRVGPFRIVGELGRGGMAAVYRACGPDGSQVALKCLFQRIAKGASRERFAREAAIRIDHPNVIRTFDAGTDENGSPWIAFELLEGQSLEDTIKAGPLPVDEALRIGAQIGRGLAAAHKAGIVHRDIKPANVFVCRDKNAKVLDFGIALDAFGLRTTAPDIIVGTPWYMAPEQAAGRRDLDARVDIWALGVVLYEMLTGTTPFRRPDALGAVLAIMRDPVRPASHARSGISAAIDEVVGRCLQKEPAKRWATAADVANAIERAREVAGEAPATSAPSHSPSQQTSSRVVALALASRIVDRDALERAMRQSGAVTYDLLGGRLVGLWGSETSYGDELERAATAVEAASGFAERIALVLGRIELGGGELEGTPLSLAEQACQSGRGVLVEDATARALRGWNTEPSSVPGWRELARRSGDMGRASLVPQPGQSPLVGRSAQLALLRASVEEAHAAKSARLILVEGPPGVGKSRLVQELTSQLGHASASVLFGRAEPSAAGSGFALVRDILARVLHPEGAVDGSAPVENVFQDSADSPWLAATLNDLLRIGAEEADPKATRDTTSGDDAKSVLWQAIRGVLTRAPTVLVVEDAHWADAESLELLARIVASLDQSPVAIVATARAELRDRAPAFVALATTTIAPTRLGVDDVATLASRLLGRPVPRAFAAQLAAHTDGVPLFVEHVVRELAGTGASPDAALPLPATVEAAIQVRLDQLSMPQRELCIALAIVDRAATVAELFVLARPTEADLRHLIAHGLVTRASSTASQGGRYRLSHALIGDTLRHMLPASRREQLHSVFAQALASRGDAPDEISRHFELAGRGTEAARWHIRASIAALRIGAHRAVILHFDRAIALGQAGDIDATQWSVLARARHLEGDLQGAMRDAARAVALARNAGERADALITQAEAAATTLDRVSARRLAAEALELAERSGATAVVVRALRSIFLADTIEGAFDRARETAARGLQMAPTLTGRARATAMSMQAELLANEGRFDEALRVTRSLCASLATPSENATRWCYESWVGEYLGALGRLEEAIETLERSVRHLRELGFGINAAMASIPLSHALCDLGRYDQALAAAATAATSGGAFEVAQQLAASAQARVLLAMGRPRDALASLDRTSFVKSIPYVTAHADLMRAQALLASGVPAEALQACERAMQTRAILGRLMYDDALTLLTHVLCLHAVGRDDDAMAAWKANAVSMRRELDALTDDALRAPFGSVPARRRLLGDRPPWL